MIGMSVFGFRALVSCTNAVSDVCLPDRSKFRICYVDFNDNRFDSIDSVALNDPIHRRQQRLNESIIAAAITIEECFIRSFYYSTLLTTNRTILSTNTHTQDARRCLGRDSVGRHDGSSPLVPLLAFLSPRSYALCSSVWSPLHSSQTRQSCLCSPNCNAV